MKIYIFFGKFINEKISRSTSTYFLRSLLFWILEARFCVERTVAVIIDLGDADNRIGADGENDDDDWAADNKQSSNCGLS